MTKTTRRFLGNTDGPYKNNTERNFEKAHLKAYLKGKDYFSFGFETVNSFRQRRRYRVQQQYSEL